MSSSGSASAEGNYRFGHQLKSAQFGNSQQAGTTSSANHRQSQQGGSEFSFSNSSESRPPARVGFSETSPPFNNQNHLPGSLIESAGRSALSTPSSEAVVAGSAPDSFSTTLERVQKRTQQFLSDQFTPIRLASHLAVLIVAGTVLVVSQMELPDWQFSLRAFPEDGLLGQPLETTGVQGEPVLPFVASQSGVSAATEAFQRAVVPFTNNAGHTHDDGYVHADEVPLAQVDPVVVQNLAPAVPIKRSAIETYVVKPGDTVLGIAARVGLKPETIQWANPQLEANPDMLRINDRLVVLPDDGVLHVVRSGETLSSIASRYKVTAESIAAYPLNGMEGVNTPLTVGKQLVVPDGTKPYISRQVASYSGPVPEGAVKGSGVFAWPTSGRITQPYWNGHRAIDVGAPTGTPIAAVDGGFVIAARNGWNNGYGRMVQIDHGNGYISLYAHMNSIFVREGESISKGTQIGTIGNTGNSTGPHLHFEVRYQGVARNPFNYLP